MDTVLAPPLPERPAVRFYWSGLHGASPALAIASAARHAESLLLVIAEDVQVAARLRTEVAFFLGASERKDETGADRTSPTAAGSPLGNRSPYPRSRTRQPTEGAPCPIPVLAFPDWETLPYDVFSPLPELVSERLATLNQLPRLNRGVLIVPVATLLQRLAPRTYLDAHTLVLKPGDRLNLDATRQRLEQAGYQCVSQVISHGDFAVRGSLLDIFPMGGETPYRIDLFDDEVETLRTFDPDSQRSLHKVDRIDLLPARELPLSDAAISAFRQRYRAAIEGDPKRSLIYREISAARAPGGIEYYLPLFFDETACLLDYLPDHVVAIEAEGCRDAAEGFLAEVAERYEQRRYDIERPPLPPRSLYLDADELTARLKRLSGVRYRPMALAERPKGFSRARQFATKRLPPLAIQPRAAEPAKALQDFVKVSGRRILLVAESTGRREMLTEQLRGFGLTPKPIPDWNAFITGRQPLGLAVAPLEQGLWLTDLDLAVVTETQLYGERVRQERRRRTNKRDDETIVRNLTELIEGAPVVHEEHGVGRYLGLKTLTVGGLTTEMLTLEYARGDKLYVPVSSLHLIARYTGASPEQAPLHRLGGDQWDRIKRRAAEKAHDVAAELLDIYARRAARAGIAFPSSAAEYAAFAAAFPFEETPDQRRTIEAVLADMTDPKPMDRVVCGDVGFGKTEVAMRAAFVAVQGGRQVAVLVPTTLLAQQHFENFADRYADWPVKIESLSRFRTAKEQKGILAGLADGTIDIVIGTHKLLQGTIQFKRLGLAIIDEEHRFGVRHKEALKALRAEVDCLTLTATPIPRTLNMAMAGLRDLSIIATPPVERHPIKTFVAPWNDVLVREACLRELKRGGQVYFLHNEVESIERQAQRLLDLVPEARIEVAHGQMRERELERVMRDFYHQRFNLLVCTTIIESGIDVPSANTILINRADRLGLAQLHQLRGRVGRSHHRAYAYLITPPTKTMTEDAKKRLEAIESLEELGAGFTLATHDLEIRGAGELLGDEQSGQIHEIGFSLYMDLLERAVQALKAGRTPDLDRPLDHGPEIDLQLPALLPADYLPDVHARLVLYKRIASAASLAELNELKVEMIDRFGLLPEPAKNLFTITALKLRVQPHGISKIEAGANSGRIVFGQETKVNPARLVQLIQGNPREFKLDGGDKLRFYRDMAEPSQRIAEVEAIVGEMTEAI